MKKLLSLLLCLALVTGLALPCAAQTEKNDEPVIFIAGFASTPTVDLTSGERVFPPSADDLLPVLKEYAWTMLTSAMRKDYTKWEEPLVDALYRAFDPIRCDENGDPVIPATTTAWVRPTGDELRAKCDPVRGYTAEDQIYYSFDWRLDLKTLAAGLHDFIEYVLAETGAEKVRLIGSSMGGCVLATYLDVYQYEYVSKAVFLSAAFQGTSVAGDPMTGNLAFDGENLVAFLSSVMGKDIQGEMLNTAVDALYQLGVTDTVALRADLIRSTVHNAVNDRALRYIFGRIPGFWALLPYDCYEEALATMTEGIVSEEFYEKIGFYHEIQGRIPQILQSGMDRGLQVSILSKYGFCGIPAVPGQKNVTDMIVDTRYSSLGATCAATDAPFTDRSGSYVSPDGFIDASTCAFPEITWFLKNISHTAHPVCELRFIDALLGCETQPTISTFPAYPQFLIQTADGELVPLTAETDASLYALPTRPESALNRLLRVFSDFRRLLDLLARLLGEKLPVPIRFV